MGLSVLGFLTLVSFQNCKQLKTDDLASTKSASTNSETGSGSAGSSSAAGSGATSTDGGAGTTDGNQELEARIKDCAQYIVKPNINSITLNGQNISEVTMNSGIATNSGDANSADFTVNVTPGISNPTEVSAKLCSITTSVRLEFIKDLNLANSASLQTAKNLEGSEVLVNGLDPAKIPGLFLKALTMRGAGDLVDSGNNVKIGFGNNRNNRDAGRLRCVEGEGYFNVIARTEINGQNFSKVEDSDFKIIKLKIINKCWNESKLVRSSNSLPASIRYGSKVAINTFTSNSKSESFAAVLSENENAGGVTGVGSVSIFRLVNSNWELLNFIQPNTDVKEEYLSDVSILNGRLYISSKYYKNRSGVVYVYEWNSTTSSWDKLSTKLEPAVAIVGQGFGAAVKAIGNRIFVSAPSYSTDVAGLNNAGAVYVFELNNNVYTQKQILVSSQDVKAGLAFGTSLDFDGKTLAVGAPMSSNTGTGFVELFLWNSTNGLFEKLPSNNLISPPSNYSMNGEKFGNSVSIIGSKLLVGSPFYSSDVNDPMKAKMGAAFYYSDFINASVVAAPTVFTTTTSGALLGQNVKIVNTGILISVPGRDTLMGAVDYYTTANIAARRLSYRHVSASSVSNDQFGFGMAAENTASGVRVVVGSVTKSDPNTSSGAAFVHDVKQ